MKYTIVGLSQEKLIGYGLDPSDALIIRWFIDFKSSGNMAKKTFENQDYYWIKYQYVIDDMPIIGITNKRSLARRLDKIVEAGVFRRYISQTKEGTYTLFDIEEKAFSELTGYTHCTEEYKGGVPASTGGVDSKVHPKDSSTKDSSTKDSNTYKQKTVSTAENKKEKYLSIWNSYHEQYPFAIVKHRSTVSISNSTAKLFKEYTEEELNKAILTYCKSLIPTERRMYKYGSINSFAVKIDKYLDPQKVIISDNTGYRDLVASAIGGSNE